MIYTDRAKYPSPLFPVGSRPLIRLYRGRTPNDLLNGRLLAEDRASITKKGITIPQMDIPLEKHGMVNPATGQIAEVNDLSYWLVDPEGNEHYLAHASTHND